MGTGIEWTDETWNVVTGCTKISPGCKHCYAEQMTKRLVAMGSPKYAAGFGKVVCHPNTLEIPLKWKKPRMIFVNSMSDLFHKDVPEEFIDQVFAVMAMSQHHTYQVLTKRPYRMAAYWAARDRHNQIELAAERIATGRPELGGKHLLPSLPCPNVWLGTSVENQKTANERIPHLLECPAAVRFLSLEPLLEAVNVQAALGDVPTVKWVIVGCESGSNGRRFYNEWAWAVADRCEEAGVRVFVKQLRDEKNRVVRGPHEWDRWPLWARQDFPEQYE